MSTTLRDRVLGALERGAPAEAFEALAPRRAELGTDPELDMLWLRALERAPTRPTLVEEVRKVLAGAPTPAHAIAACAALNAAAQAFPPDAPPPERGPATLAAEIAAATLAQLGEGEEEVAAYLWINRANALRAMGPEHDEAAREAYGEALERHPEKGGWWFDLGVLHKWRGRWQEALDCALRARARLGDQRAVLWNAALAATALGQGDVAAGLWRDLGIEARLSEGGMPIVEGVPEVRVRAPSVASGHGVLPEPERSFEVLWVAPTSPCHGVVISPSFRDCPVDWGDVVLWDGAPVSQDPPVFPLLEILREGEEHRFRFVALAKRGDVEKIVERLPEGVQAFAHPVGVEKDGDVLAYGKLVAPASVDLKALRGRFEAALAELRTMRLAMPELYEKTGPTKRAGQEHQAWRGIERVALKRGLVPDARADEERDDADAEEGGAA